jgi:hypothetical protein
MLLTVSLNKQRTTLLALKEEQIGNGSLRRISEPKREELIV